MAEAKKANGRESDVVYRGREMSQPEANQIRAGVLDQRDNDVHTLYDYSLVAFGAMVVVSTLFGWVVAGKVLRPLPRSQLVGPERLGDEPAVPPAPRRP